MEQPIVVKQASDMKTVTIPPSNISSKRVPMDNIELLQNPRVSRSERSVQSRPSSVSDSEFLVSKEDDVESVVSDKGGFLQQQQQQVEYDDSDSEQSSQKSSHRPTSSPTARVPQRGSTPPIRTSPPPSSQTPPPQQQQQPNGFFSRFFGSKPNEDDQVSVQSSNSNYEDQAKRKQEYLYKLDRLEKMGYTSSRKYTIQHDYEDIRGEYERLKKQRDADNAVKFSRKMLMAFVSGSEFLNERFDPFGLKLSGWSEAIMEDLPSYDEVFEELHEKYKTKIQMAPELRLLWMVGSSAFMFHLTNSLFNPPQMKNIMSRPDMKQASMNFMQDQFARTMAEEEMAERDALRRGATKREMKGPSGVDDLLSNLRNGRMPPPPKFTRTSSPHESDDDDILSGDESDVRQIPAEQIFNRPSVNIPIREPMRR